jgi:hypothetical protein
MRTIGGVVGGLVGAANLSAVTIPGTAGVPEESAYTLMFLIAGVVALGGAAAVLRIPARRRTAAGAAERQPAAGAPAPAPAAGTTTTGSA